MEWKKFVEESPDSGSHFLIYYENEWYIAKRNVEDVSYQGFDGKWYLIKSLGNLLWCELQRPLIITGNK